MINSVNGQMRNEQPLCYAYVHTWLAKREKEFSSRHAEFIQLIQQNLHDSNRNCLNLVERLLKCYSSKGCQFEWENSLRKTWVPAPLYPFEMCEDFRSNFFFKGKFTHSCRTRMDSFFVLFEKVLLFCSNILGGKFFDQIFHMGRIWASSLTR